MVCSKYICRSRKPCKVENLERRVKTMGRPERFFVQRSSSLKKKKLNINGKPVEKNTQSILWLFISTNDHDR